MRKVTVTRDEFDDLFYTACTSGAAESLEQLEIATRVVRKLQDPSYTRKEVIPSDILEAARKQRQKLLPSYYLDHDHVALTFEEDEWRLVCSRLKDHIHRVNIVVAPQLYELIKRFDNAGPDATVATDKEI
jgi:hypothetical protein